MSRRLDQAIAAHLRGRGARANDVLFPGMYPLVLDTELGPLLLDPKDGWVAMRFAEVSRACAALPHMQADRLNRHSGKYNVHFPKGASLEHRLAMLNAALEPVGLLSGEPVR